MRIDYDIQQVTPYINWLYFFHAWGVKEGQDVADALLDDAYSLLRSWRHTVHTYSLFLLSDCHSEDDDIVLSDDRRIPLLRQQTAKEGEPYLCLADFVSPLQDKIGMFCCTCDAVCDGDEYTRLLKQTVADRLAEACSERLHQMVRRELWGYAPDERLTMAEIHAERFQGIRPAVGYPSLPDQSLNFVLDDILHFRQIGVCLTENGAMRPHASVSGLMISHPMSRYFAVGTVGEDQLEDYACRRKADKEWIRKFIAN